MAEEGEGVCIAAFKEDQVDKLLECSVCLERYKQPKILPCQHTICLSPCLEGIVNYFSNTVRCPHCRETHNIPHGGVNGFPNNLLAVNFLSLKPCLFSKPLQGVQAYFSGMKNEIGEQICRIKKELTTVSFAISVAQAQSKDLNEELQVKKKEIIDKIDFYKNQLETRKQTLLSKLEECFETDTAGFKTELANMEMDYASISGFCESSESALSRKCTEDELINMEQECQQSLSKIRTTTSTQLKNYSFKAKVSFQDIRRDISSFGKIDNDLEETKYKVSRRSIRFVTRDSYSDYNKYRAISESSDSD